jgi:hypothetical protein
MKRLLAYLTFDSLGTWNLWDNLFAPDRAETLGDRLFFRLFELFVVGGTIYLAWYWGQYIPRISDIVLPLGIAQYVDPSFMYGTSLPYVNVGLITALVVLGYLRVSRYAYIAAFLLLHVQFAARYVLGEIPHSSNVLGMTLLGLALATLLFREASARRRFTFGFTYFFVGLGYTLAAFCKLIGTGPSWIDGRHLWMWIHEKSIDAFALTGELQFNLLQELALSNEWLATTMLTFSLMGELGAVLMWWRPLRTPAVLVVIGLHLGIYWIMNIMFYLTFYELLLLALPWAVWLNRLLPDRVLRSALALLDGPRGNYAPPRPAHSASE